MQSKIFVNTDTSFTEEADCCITTLVTASLTMLLTNICTNEISKLLDAKKNLHSDETSGQKQILFHYKFSYSRFTNCTSKNMH